MTPDRLWALASTAVAVAAAVFALRTRLRLWALRRKAHRWTIPAVDPGRYHVVFHLHGETHELYHGYDGLKARHAYEHAPMEAGMAVEFYEWGQNRGRRSA